MSIKTKVTTFVAKHGFTVKSWFIAFLICPPAAVFIPFKIRHVGRAARIAMVSITVIVHGILISGSVAVVGTLATRAVRAVIG